MIDVHTHCHQPEHRGGAWERYAERAYGGRDWSFTPGDYSRLMRAGGVDCAVVFGVTALAAGLDTPNAFVAEFCSEVDIDTVPFMALDLSTDRWRSDMADGLARGFRGVKLYPTSALFDPTDLACDEFYQRAAEHHLVLLWHMGATPNPSGKLSYSNPLVVDEVARRHPTLTHLPSDRGRPPADARLALIARTDR